MHIRSGLTLIILSTLSTLFGACSNLKTPKRANLIPLKNPQVIGIYPVSQIHTVSNHSYENIVWNYFVGQPGRDSIEVKRADHFKLELKDEKHLTATLFNGNQVLKTRVLKGKLKEGYFRLQHRLKFQGIPLLFWGLSSQKTQFGLGNNQELYIDRSSTRNGGLLIFLSGTPDVTDNTTVPAYHYGAAP